MWASLVRVTGTKESDWVVNKEMSSGRYRSALKLMKEGDRNAFSRVLYTIMMYPDQLMLFKNLANGALGLKTEDIDVYTKKALQMQKEGAFAPQSKLMRQRESNSSVFNLSLCI